MTQQTMFANKKGSVLKKKQKEENIQLAFCKHVKKEYPSVIFTCDFASGMKLPIFIAGKHKLMRSSRAMPDFSADEPNSLYHGFRLELKIDSVYTKKGELKKQLKTIKKTGEKYDHLKEQWEMILKLRERGYYADFGQGLEDCKKKFDDYMKISK